MLTSTRQLTRQLRLWLIAAAAVLALTTVLEAGHAHGVFTQTDDQCTLCQHSVALDKFLSAPTVFTALFLLALIVSNPLNSFIPFRQSRFALIRAPPTQLHTR